MSKTQVPSPIAGSISQIHIGDGERVSSGERIGEIELMKTMFSIEANADGIITWKLPLGSVVAEDEIIAEIED